MTFLREGEDAPDFTLPKSGGGTVSLSDFRGRTVILYFYPKDDTTGCTKQACDLRDSYPQIEDAGAVVLGISPDSVDSHNRFVAKYGLPFTLLADADHRVAEIYGAWTERHNYGRTYMGIQRSTFLIDRRGQITKVWENVKASDYLADVMRALGVDVGVA